MHQDDRQINVNRALRRRAKSFGISRDVAIVLGFMVMFCITLSYFGVPINFIAAIFASLFLSILFVLRDGMGEVLAKIRKPRYYTRGCFRYRSPLRKQK